MKNIASDLAKNLRRLRLDRGMTQDQLANKAGIAYSTVAKLEQGAIKSPSLATAAAIAKSLDIDVNELLEERAKNVSLKQSSKIRFIYFDKNGVLVRFYHRAFTMLARKTHQHVNKIENIFWHYNTAANRGEISMKEFDKYISDELGLKDFHWMDYYMKTVEPMKQMRQFIEEIHEKIPVGILTNTFPGFVDHMIEHKVLPDVEYRAIVDSSQVGYVKPEPKIYEIAEKMAGYSGGDILFIDDSRTNLMPATKLGWNVLWFDDYRPEESIAKIREVVGL